MLQIGQRTYLKSVLMLRTVQRPYLEICICWCCNLLRDMLEICFRLIFQIVQSLTWKVYSADVDVTNCSKTLLGKCVMLMLQTDQRPCLQNIFFWWCKLFKDLTWNICSSDVANCSKNLLESVYSVDVTTSSNYLTWKVYSADVAICSETCLKYDVANCSKALLGKCIPLMLMQTVQRPYLKSVLLWCCKLIKELTWNVYSCWCYKLFKNITWKVYSADNEMLQTMFEKCTPLMLQIVQRPSWNVYSVLLLTLKLHYLESLYSAEIAFCLGTMLETCCTSILQIVQSTYLESVFCWCYKLFKEHGKCNMLMFQTVERTCLKNIFFWCCKLAKYLSWKMYSCYGANCWKHLLESVNCWCYNCSKTLLGKCVILMLQTDQRSCLKNILFWCCKLFKDLTWNMDSSDLANCSKHLLQKCILLIL